MCVIRNTAGRYFVGTFGGVAEWSASQASARRFGSFTIYQTLSVLRARGHVVHPEGVTA